MTLQDLALIAMLLLSPFPVTIGLCAVAVALTRGVLK
jgi:hypothetical protein